MVKDEIDILPHTLPRMADQLDHIIIADNCSTDGTREYLGMMELLDDYTVIDDNEVAYYQSSKMTALAHRAREMGADWVVPFDADEVWWPIGNMNLDTGASIIHAALYNHIATSLDVETPDPVRRMSWRFQDPGGLPKVMCRTHPGLVIEQGNHGAHYPGLGVVQADYQGLQVRHFPYRSVEQMVRKARNGAAAYAATNLPHTIGQHWREYGRFLEDSGESAIEEIFNTWFHFDDPASNPDLVCDPCPI